MSTWAKIALLGVVLAVAGNSAAYAVTPGQSKIKTQGQSVPQLAGLGTLPSNTSYGTDVGFGKSSQSKVYQFNLKGKWGIKFDVNQPETKPSGVNDIEAGAYYKLTPSVRIAGTVGLGEKSDPLKPESSQLQNAKKQPRVRLETTFKF